MFAQTMPASIFAFLQTFQGCFTKSSFPNFVVLTVGWIMCQGRHSISRVIQAAGEVTQNRHHSIFYRFLSRAQWSADAVGKVLFHLVERFLPWEIFVIVDDTLVEKTGPHIFGAFMHYDAARSTYGRGTKNGRKTFFAFGHNWVVLAVWIPLPWDTKRGLALPILCRLYRSRKRCPKAHFRKRTELAAEMLGLFTSWLPEERPLHLLGDAEYACATLVRRLPPRTSFTGPIVMDAAVYEKAGKYSGRGCPRKKGKRLLSPRQLIASSSSPWRKVQLMLYGQDVTILTKTQMCMWYNTAGTRWGRMVVTRDPSGRLKERAFFSTKRDVSIEEVLAQFARRWELECTFRNVKQVLGLEDPQNGWWRRKTGKAKKKKAGPNPRGTRGQKAVTHSMGVALAAYGLIVVWYFNHGDRKADVARARSEAPWYRHKTSIAFNDMLAAIRGELWAARFSAYPLFRRVRDKIRRLLPHWLLAA